MKSYTITVNGNVYDVTVEENGSVSAPAAAPRRAAAPAARQQLQRQQHRQVAQEALRLRQEQAGKVFKIEASVGQAVKKGDAVLVLEIMKMETPVVAPQDGTVASINVNVGDMVEAGALLATLN